MSPKAFSIRCARKPADGDDTLNWIARQPWSDGKVGMIGGSYRGIVQWKAAALDNPHLKAIFPVVSGWDDYRDRFYSTGGAMKLGNRLEWMAENLKVPGYQPDFGKFVLHLPLRTSDVAATGRSSAMFQDALNHPAFDSFWRAISTREQIRKVRVPVFAVGGWYDNFVESDLEAYAALQKSRRGRTGFWWGRGRTTCRTASRAWISGRIPRFPFARCNWNGSTSG